MANTANRNYPLPVASNPVRDDVARLISAFEAIDGDVAGLLAALATKAAVEHGHSLADIAGLVDALNGKASVGHTHSLSSLSDVSIDGAPAGRPLTIQPGGTVGIGPDWAATIAAALSAGDVQVDRNDVSSGAKLVRVDGAHAAALANHVNYYGSGDNRNIDTVPAGDVGLYYDGNPGTWPVAPAGRFWLVTTQRLYTGSAAIQRACAYASTSPDMTSFEYVRLRSNSGVWSSWRRVFHEDHNGNFTFAGRVSISGAVPVLDFADTDNGVTGQIGSGTTDLNIASNKPIDIRPEGVRAAYISREQWLLYTSEQLRARLHDGGMEITGAVDADAVTIGGEPLPFTKPPYTSPEQVITAAGALTLPHGLGVLPKLLVAEIVCKTAEYGWTVGQRIPVPLGGEYISGNNGSLNATAGIDGTDIQIQYGTGAGGGKVFLIHDASGVVQYATNANWRFVVRAFA